MSKFNFDKYGLIVQTNGDRGDTAARTGQYYVGLWIWKNIFNVDTLNLFPYSQPVDFKNALDKLEIEPGIYVRHPDGTEAQEYVADPKRFSRDQQTPLVIAMGLYGFTTRLKRLQEKQAARFLRKYQNADYPSPEHWNFYRRAFRENCSFEMGDCFQLANSYLSCFNTYRNPDSVDINNHVLALIQSSVISPTWASKRAVKVLTESYPKNNGTERFKTGSHILDALAFYHREESFGNEGFVDLFTPIIDHFFKP